MIKIKTKKIKNASEVLISGSKSYTHRILIASALADGTSILHNLLESEDTNFTISALQKFGVSIKKDGEKFIVKGMGGNFEPFKDEILLGNSGTSMRFLCSVATLGKGEYILNGTERMQKRPVKELILSLSELGVKAVSINNTNCPPIKICGKKIIKKKVSIDCSSSSQYLSSLLLIAPLTQNGLEISVKKGIVSKPYIDMTLEIMKKFGIKYKREGYDFFKIEGVKKQKYLSGNYEVEPDASNASYFFIIAAITKTKIKVKNLKKKSNQGDLKFLEVLQKMGVQIKYENDGITVIGGDLKSITVDMSDMPDMVPSLAVVSAFAKGTTKIINIAHLAIKESNRITATASELSKLGVNVTYSTSSLTIEGGTIKNGAFIKTYNDHRIAMSFATIGLVQEGIEIENENCVQKSFPNFWTVFNSLYLKA